MPNKRTPFRQPVFISLILVWVAIALAAYYAYHRPFLPAFALHVGGAFFEFFVLSLMLAAAGGLGTRLLPNLTASPLVQFSVRAALGLGAFSIGYLLVGSTLGTNGFLAWALLLASVVILRRKILVWFADLSDFKKLWKRSGSFERAIAWLCLAIFVFALLKAFVPPTAFDSLTYHLALPKVYVAQGHIGYIANNIYSGFPELSETLITWLLALGMQHGALFGWALGTLALIGILGHISARLGEKPAWVAVAALLSGASLAGALSSGYVDWSSILMGWGAILFLDLWASSCKPQLALWAGMFAGLAFGTKYTAGLFAPLGFLVILFIGSRDWRAAARFSLGAFAFALPWLLKNFIATGSPFYPLLLPGGAMDSFRLGYYQGFSPQGNWMDAILLPLRATWAGIEGGRIGTAPGYETSIGPLLLLLGLLALLPKTLNKNARPLKKIAGIVAVGGLVGWAVAGALSGHLIRTQLYYVLFPAFTILAAFGFSAVGNFDSPKLRLSRVVQAVIVLALGFNVLQIGIESVNSGLLQYWTGELTEQAYLEKNLGLYSTAIQSLRDDFPSYASVLMLWEPRGFACAPECDPDEIIDRWPHDLFLLGSPQAVIDSWRAAGFTNVLYYRLGAKFVYEDPEHFHPFDFASMDRALSALPVVRDFNGDYLLLSLNK